MKKIINFLLLPILLCGGQALALPTPAADHHMHIHSADGGRVLQQAREVAGKPSDEASPVTADQVVESMDRAGLEQATILSNAYMFGMPELDLDDEYGRVRAENDYVASQVARYPERLAGFYSVNPLAEYALDEISRCAESEHLTGLKLHLANSDVDLRNPEHVVQLGRVFARANDLGQPIIIHLRTRNDAYGAHDARIFIEQVLARAPDVVIQVAHLAGWSGMDEATLEVVDTFAAAMEQDDDGSFDGLLFDMSETVIPESRANGKDEYLEQVRKINRRSARAIKRLGVDRVVFGSDWVSPGKLKPRASTLARNLPLPAEMVAEVAANRAPYLGNPQ